MPFKAEIEGEKKYSPPRGTTKRLGAVKDQFGLFGIRPVIVLGLSRSWPIYSPYSEADKERGERNAHDDIESVTLVREVRVVSPCWRCSQSGSVG